MRLGDGHKLEDERSHMMTYERGMFDQLWNCLLVPSNAIFGTCSMYVRYLFLPFSRCNLTKTYRIVILSRTRSVAVNSPSFDLQQPNLGVGCCCEVDGGLAARRCAHVET